MLLENYKEKLIHKSSSQLQIKNVLYSVINELGSGSYGKVLLAYDEYSRKVAIKLLKPKYSGEGIDSCTLRELNILLEMDHPNIIKCINFEYNWKSKIYKFNIIKKKKLRI